MEMVFLTKTNQITFYKSNNNDLLIFIQLLCQKIICVVFVSKNNQFYVKKNQLIKINFI